MSGVAMTANGHDGLMRWYVEGLTESVGGRHLAVCIYLQTRCDDR